MAASGLSGWICLSGSLRSSFCLCDSVCLPFIAENDLHMLSFHIYLNLPNITCHYLCLYYFNESIPASGWFSHYAVNPNALELQVEMSAQVKGAVQHGPAVPVPNPFFWGWSLAQFGPLILGIYGIYMDLHDFTIYIYIYVYNYIYISIVH